MNVDLLKETEENLIGFVLRTGNPLCILSLNGKFYGEKHNIIASAILSLYRNDEKIDIISVAGELEKIGGNDIAPYELAHFFNATAIIDPEYSVKKIESEWKKRATCALLSRAAESADKAESVDIKKILSSVVDECIAISSGEESDASIQTAFDEIEQEMGESLEARLSGKKTIGIETGYKLDGMIDGLRPAHLWTIAAYTSTGKTTLAMNIARFILEQKKNVVVFSLEATKTDLMTKLLSMDTYIPTRGVLHAAEDNAQYERYKKSRDDMLAHYRLRIYDNKHDIDDIVLSMRQENAREHVDVFMLDYIQNVTSSRRMDEYERITYAMSAFKRALNITKSPMILFSQISNEDSKSKNSLLMNGKGSGAIKYASSLFAYLKTVGSDEEILKYYSTGEDVPLELIVNKNQHGRLGTIRMKRKQETGEIYEY